MRCTPVILICTLALAGCALRSVSAEEVPATQPGESPAAPVSTQPAGPPLIPAPSGPLLRFDELTFELGFEAEMRRRIVRAEARQPVRGTYRQTNDDWRFEETLGLRTRGDVLGERFLRYDASVRWGLSQESFRERRPGPDRFEREDGFVLEYDARVSLFPAGRISASAFASQLDDRVPRPFLPSLDRRRERYGGEILFNDRILPMRLSFEDLYEQLNSPADRALIDDEQRRERTLRYELTWQPDERQRLHLDYSYEDRREQYSGTRTVFDTVRNYFTLDHALHFGPDARSRIETTARFQDETGDLARDIYEISPQLRLQHTDSLATTYRGQFLRESHQGLDFSLYRGDIGLTHSLGERLVSSLNLYGLTQEAEAGGDTREWGGIASFSFSDEKPLGRFSASLTYTHAFSRTDSAGGDGVVVGEAVTFRDPLPVFLARSNVRPGTILVTDAERRRTFLAGQDYLVVRSGQYTALSRVRTGRILDGQTVLVSYLYGTTSGLELNRDRLDWRIQQVFKLTESSPTDSQSFDSTLTPYYAGSLQFEAIDRQRFLTYGPRDVNRHRLGLTWRVSRLKTTIPRGGSLGLEYEYNDDSVDPYQALHANADLALLEQAPHSLGLTGRYSFFRFAGERELKARNTSLLDAGVSYRCVLGPHLEGQLAALYRFEDDSLSGRTHGVDISGSINWRIGLFVASFEIEYDLLDLPGSSDGTLVAWLRLRRDLPLIGSRQ
jgi:hypothetical protein